MANLIPPANGVSQDNYFMSKSNELAVFLRKIRLTKTALAAKAANFFSNNFWFWLDKRSNKFATSLLALLAGG